MAISKHDKQALADLFVNMGVPLVSALQTVEGWSGTPDDMKTRAEKLSKLLTASVEMATKITKKLEIRDAYTLENIRGKILKIVTPLVANYYTQNGDVPADDKIADMIESFDVLLSFAESVSPVDEKGSKATKMARMVEICTPLLSALRDDDMGQGMDKMFQQIMSGLGARADQLAKVFNEDDAIESGLYKSVMMVFTSCYEKQAGSASSLDEIWSDCDERLAVLYGLSRMISDKTGIAMAKDDGSTKAAPPPAKPVEDEKPAVNKAEPKSEPAPKPDNADKAEETDDDDDGEFNPMAFFS